MSAHHHGKPEYLQPAVEHKLRDAWRRERRFHHVRGSCILLVWLVGMILLDLVVDWLFLANYRVPGWSRILLLGINLVTLAVVFRRQWWSHLRRYDRTRVALEIERKHPELKSLLISYVQIGDAAQREMQASPALIAAMRKQAVTMTRPVNFNDIVNFQMLKRLAMLSAAVLLAFSALSFHKSDFFATLVRRLLNPSLHVPYPTRTVIRRVSGDLSVRQGADLRITAWCSGEIPDEGRLHLKAGEGGWETQPMLRQGTDSFACLLPDIQRGFEYYIEVGDDESEVHRTTVVPAPKILRRTVTAEFPAYTGLAPRQHEGYYLDVLEGTTLTWEMDSDRPLRRADIVIDGSNILAMAISGQGRTVRFTQTVHESFEYQFRWKEARHGFEYESPGPYVVNVIPDVAPDVDIVRPLQDEKATTRKTLSVTFEARDDYGIADAHMVWALEDGPESRWPVGSVTGAAVEKTFSVKLDSLTPDLEENTVFTYYIEVRDGYEGAPDAPPEKRGPHVSQSLKRRVYILSIQEYLRSILEEQLRWIDEIEVLREEEGDAATAVDELEAVEMPEVEREDGIE